MSKPKDKDPSPAVAAPETTWQYQAEGQDTAVDDAPTQDLSPDIETVRWTGDEFIAHHKTMQWYAALGAGTAMIAVLVYLLTSRDFVPAGVVVLVAIVFAIFASRKPRKLEYVIDSSGIQIGARLYPFSGFKSFSLVEEESAQAVWLMPLKRFMPIIAVYFDMKDGQKIVDALSRVLPVEDRQPDIVDHLMHRLKF